MKKILNRYLSKIKRLVDKAVEASSFEFFDDDICRNELDEYWCSFAYETA